MIAYYTQDGQRIEVLTTKTWEPALVLPLNALVTPLTPKRDPKLPVSDRFHAGPGP
jgi:hypothetical protein